MLNPIDSITVLLRTYYQGKTASLKIVPKITIDIVSWNMYNNIFR